MTPPEDCPACNTHNNPPDATSPTPGGGVLADYTCRTCSEEWTTGWWEGTN